MKPPGAPAARAAVPATLSGALTAPATASQQALLAEHRYLLRLRRTLHQLPVPTPGAAGLRRLNQSIDALQHCPPGQGIAALLRAWWRRWFPAKQGRPRD